MICIIRAFLCFSFVWFILVAACRGAENKRVMTIGFILTASAILFYLVA